jgi:hypothetical protein
MVIEGLAPTPSPLYKVPSTPSRRPSSHREPSLIQIKIHHKRGISTELSICRSRIVKLRVRES